MSASSPPTSGAAAVLRGMDRYIKGDVLGEGTFGVVVKAMDKQTNTEVALKKIRLQKVKEGVNMTALREIKLLKVLLCVTRIESSSSFVSS